SPVSASVAHLKVKGTAIVASLAPKSRIIEITTRSLRSRRSAGQMYGHSPPMMASSEPPSPDTSRFKAAIDRGGESVIGSPAATGRASRPSSSPHIEIFVAYKGPANDTHER